MSPQLIDTHCHPYFGHYDQDRDEVMKRTFETCTAIICVGAGVHESGRSVELAGRYGQVYASVGVHPHDIDRDDVRELDALAALPKVVAIGECGLDYKEDTVHGSRPVNKAKQAEVFRYQLNLADKLDLPVIIHARECWEDLIPMLKEAQPKSGVIHSWTGGLKEADEIIKLGLHISFSGMLTYPANSHIREVAAMAPLGKIMIETDSPFLPPQSLRGQRNEPGNVKMVAEKLAEIRDVGFDEIAQVTTANARQLFNLPK